METKVLFKIYILVVFSATLVDASSRLSSCTCDKLLLSCGDPPCVANGVYNLTHPYEDTVGATATLICDSGFTPSHSATITCLITGFWGEVSFCQSIPFAGTSYVTVFPRVTIDPTGGKQIRRIYVTTDTSTQVNITSPFNSVSTTKTTSDSALENFDIGFTLTDNGTLSFKVIKIEADNPINVFTLDSRDTSDQKAFDAWLLRPIDVLSSEYVVITTDMAPKFVVVGLTNGTEVNITRPGEGPITQTVNGHQALPIFIDDTTDSVNNDLTGTIISASEVVAVFSGGFFATVPLSTVGSKDQNIVQLIGVERFYTMCLFAPFEPRDEYEVKVVVSEDNTNVTYSDGVTTSSITLNRGEKFQEYFTSGLPLVIKADKPFLAAQFSVNENVGNVNLGDSSMVLGVHPDNYLNKYVFFVPNEYTKHRLRVVIPTSDVGQLRLNGNPIVADPSLAFASEGVTWVYTDVSKNTYYELETTDGAFFGADLYGLLRFGQYTYSLGQRYKHL